MKMMLYQRKGLGKGKGTGWKNILGNDSHRHSLASKGIKSAQKIPQGMCHAVNVPKSKVQKIEIMRAEGSYDDDPNLGKWQTFYSFSEANKRLREIAKTAPKGGAYDKTDVKVTWENGDEYSGRWDVKNINEPNNDTDVAEHIKDSLEFYAGLKERKPWNYDKTGADKESVRMLKSVDLGKPKKKHEPKKEPAKEDTKLKASDLSNFTVSEQYHKWSILYPNMVLTDGAQYVAEKGGAYWFMDIVGSYQHSPKFRKEEFQVWKLKKTKGNEAIVVAEDGNGRKLATQKIPYTDFPLNEVKLYLRDGVIMLPSEY